MLIKLVMPMQNLVAFISPERHNALVIDRLTRRTLGALLFGLDKGATWLFFPQSESPPNTVSKAQRKAQRKTRRKARHTVRRVTFCNDSTIIQAIEKAYRNFLTKTQ